jgi:hypothetical protein
MTEQDSLNDKTSAEIQVFSESEQEWVPIQE